MSARASPARSRYVLGEGRDPKTGELKAAGPTTSEPGRLDRRHRASASRSKAEADAELARRDHGIRRAESDQPHPACEKDCVHLSLAWRPGEKPTREQMEDAARDALEGARHGNAKALFVAHNDEDYAHVHIVASKINPATGRAYDLKGKLAQACRNGRNGYEREHGGIISRRREDSERVARRDRRARRRRRARG